MFGLKPLPTLILCSFLCGVILTTFLHMQIIPTPMWLKVGTVLGIIGTGANIIKFYNELKKIV